jgi:hypothetical protein
MPTRLLCRPIVILRVQCSICVLCSILIFFIKTVRCSKPHCTYMLYVLWSVALGSCEDSTVFQNSTSVEMPRHWLSFTEDIWRFLRQFATFFCNFAKFLSASPPFYNSRSWSVKAVKGHCGRNYFRRDHKKQRHRNNIQILGIQMVFSSLINEVSVLLTPTVGSSATDFRVPESSEIWGPLHHVEIRCVSHSASCPIRTRGTFVAVKGRRVIST